MAGATVVIGALVQMSSKSDEKTLDLVNSASLVSDTPASGVGKAQLRVTQTRPVTATGNANVALLRIRREQEIEVLKRFEDGSKETSSETKEISSNLVGMESLLLSNDKFVWIRV